MTCIKATYQDLWLAWKQAIHDEIKNNKVYAPYKCPNCQFYHLHGGEKRDPPQRLKARIERYRKIRQANRLQNIMNYL